MSKVNNPITFSIVWYEPAMPVHLSPAVVPSVQPRVQTASVSSPAQGGPDGAAAVPDPAIAGPSCEFEPSPSQSVEKDRSPGPSDECGKLSGRRVTI